MYTQYVRSLWLSGPKLDGTKFNLLFPGNSVTGTTLKYIYAAIVGYCGMDAKKRKAMSHLKFGARLNISAYNTSPTCTITKAAYSLLNKNTTESGPRMRRF